MSAAAALSAGYLTLAAVLTLHALLQVRLWRASRHRRPVPPTPAADPGPQPLPLPTITVQLPVYNERYVIGPLLAAVSRLRYPRDRLEIQVLDDSTDATTSLIAVEVDRLRARGLDVTHLRRGTRNGFKAGALEYGLTRARGDLVALFDADAQPPPDFLLAAVPHFADPRVALVQGRWRHTNADRSWLTRLQALMLDVHFDVEQAGRSALGCFVNFNGTAGVWRADAVRDAGGWSAATLTEDLDLSYRAQLRGWRFVYRGDLGVPSELPDDLDAFRRQQFRWMQGVAENARRLAPAVLRARVPGRVRLHAVAHLLESALFVVIAVQQLLAGPVAALAGRGMLPGWIAWNPFALASFVLLAPVYGVRGVRALPRSAATYLGFLLLSTGLAVHHAVAVVAGFAGHVTPFERTPKRGAGGPPVGASVGASVGPVYRARRSAGLARVELVAGAAMAAGLLWAAQEGALLLAWQGALGLAALLAVRALGVAGRPPADRRVRGRSAAAEHRRSARPERRDTLPEVR